MNLPGGIPEQSSGSSAPAPDPGGSFTQSRLRIGLLVPILCVAALAAFFPPDGSERADWLQFIGGFHPLVVHFPIALFLLVPILEIAGRNVRFAYLRRSVDFVLALATIAAATAAILGWCLARSGGYSGGLITQHMWGGVGLSILCWCCWLLRARLPEVGVAYVVALAVGVGLVAWTGYRGGQLSLGPDHLTEHMPHAMRSMLGLASSREAIPVADPNTFYGARIQTIFAARCIACHGANKHKGNLRLDSYRALMRGGKDGKVIQARNVQASDLFRRITLPPSHDDFMPKGKPPLTADQVKAIELWIDAGASETLPINAIKNAPGSAPAAEVTFEEIDPAAVARLRSTLGPVVSQLQKKFPGILEYDSRGSADLRLNASMFGSKFDDRDLEAFAPVAGHITVADLSRTAVTDHSAAELASMKHLRVLRLMNTRVSDATVLRLQELNLLESLNLYGTAITPAVLPAIAKLPRLMHLYAGQTKILPGKPVPENLAGKVVF